MYRRGAEWLFNGRWSRRSVSIVDVELPIVLVIAADASLLGFDGVLTVLALDCSNEHRLRLIKGANFVVGAVVAPAVVAEAVAALYFERRAAVLAMDDKAIALLAFYRQGAPLFAIATPGGHRG